jgi:EKC/KEOPS complex subunit CGI121/TPRKB
MVIETVSLDHLPASYAVHLAFFRNVSNAAFLHSQLLAHNSDFEYAFIDASIVRALPLPPMSYVGISCFIVVLLANPSLPVRSSRGSNCSRPSSGPSRPLPTTLSRPPTFMPRSFIPLARLITYVASVSSPSSAGISQGSDSSILPQIADAYRRYGMSPGSKNILVVKVSVNGQPAGENIDQHLKTHVEGDSVPVTDEYIAPGTDMAKVSKYYKLNGLAWLDSIKEGSLKRQEMEALILGAMALRGV